MLKTKRGMMLLLLAAMLAGLAQGDVTVIPASEDVYVSMGEENDKVEVFNQTDILLCAINVTEDNLTRVVSYPGNPVVQFNISNLNLSEDDMAVLLLKAESISQGSNPIMVVLITIGSDWYESSDYTTFLVNFLPAWNIIKKNDATAMSSNTDGDVVFAFDVSKKLRDALAEGDRISFWLQAFSNSSAEIAFFSRESGEGPGLVIMPYPRADGNDTADMADMAEIPDSISPMTNISRIIQFSNLSNMSNTGGMNLTA